MSARDLRWRAGAPLRAVLIGAVRLYRMTLSGVMGGQCRFYPSCSHYAEDAIHTHGVLRGCGLTAWRILRCNPFGSGGLDRVPPRIAMHDAVIRVSTHDVAIQDDREMTGADS